MISSDEKKTNSTPKSEGIEQEFQSIAKKETTEILKDLSCNEQGISDDERELRLEKYGCNDLSASQKHNWIYFMLHSFTDAFIIVLLILAFVTFIVEKDIISGAIILVLACMSAIIRFVQDYGSYRDMQKLKDMAHDTVRIQVPCKNGVEVKEVPVENVVPGDIQLIGSGDIVCGDLYLLESKDLFVSVSAFTGESVPVEKSAGPDSRSINAAELNNICLGGSTVNSGTGIGIVVRTGKSSYLGKISSSIHTQKKETDFDHSLSKITKILISYMIVVVLFVLLINGLVKKNWLEAFLFSISVAVGITPGMLPMIVNGTLAKGAKFLAKKKTIVKNMSAIQNLGAIDVLCTDKTGTLTMDHVILQNYLDINGNDSHLVLNYAWINSYYSTGVKNLIDRAILSYGEKNDVNKYAGGYLKSDEIPYDFERRRMSVVISNPEGKHLDNSVEELLPKPMEEVLITKGALESVLKCCTRVRINKEYSDINSADIEKINALSDKLNHDGMHVIAVAAKKEILILIYPSMQKTKMT